MFQISCYVIDDSFEIFFGKVKFALLVICVGLIGEDGYD